MWLWFISSQAPTTLFGGARIIAAEKLNSENSKAVDLEKPGSTVNRLNWSVRLSIAPTAHAEKAFDSLTERLTKASFAPCMEKVTKWQPGQHVLFTKQISGTFHVMIEGWGVENPSTRGKVKHNGPGMWSLTLQRRINLALSLITKILRYFSAQNNTAIWEIIHSNTFESASTTCYSVNFRQRTANSSSHRHTDDDTKAKRNRVEDIVSNSVWRNISWKSTKDETTCIVPRKTCLPQKHVNRQLFVEFCEI